MRTEATAADLLDLALRTAGLTQEQLARRAHVSQKHVSQVLTGRARFSAQMAARFQRVMRDSTLAERLLTAQARVDAALAVAALPITVVPYPQDAFAPGWERAPRTDDGHVHDWEEVAVVTAPGSPGQWPEQRELVMRCAVCHCPGCIRGTTTAGDPCIERRHHPGPHIHQSGAVVPIGG